MGAESLPSRGSQFRLQSFQLPRLSSPPRAPRAPPRPCGLHSLHVPGSLPGLSSRAPPDACRMAKRCRPPRRGLTGPRMREGGVAALSQFHGVRPARQLLKPQLRRGPGRPAQALQRRQGVSERSPGSCPEADPLGGEGGGAADRADPAPRSPARRHPARRAERSGAARAEGGVFPERDCRENTGAPYSWSGESTAGGREPGRRAGRGEGRGGSGRGAGKPRRARGRERRVGPRAAAARRSSAGRGEAQRKGRAERAARHSPGGRGGWGWSRGCGASHPLPGV